MPHADPELYDYSPIVDRPRLYWPRDARVAVWLAPNVEFYELDPPVGPWRAPWPRPHPDVLGYALRDYGNRAGIWRLFEVLDRHRARGSVALNVALCQHHPEIVEACRERGWEFFSHRVYNTRYTYGMDEAQERALIEDAIVTVERHTGTRLQGWLSPALSNTERTPHLLAEYGIRYSADFFHDDQPFPLRVRLALRRGRAVRGPRPGPRPPPLVHRAAPPDRRPGARAGARPRAGRGLAGDRRRAARRLPGPGALGCSGWASSAPACGRGGRICRPSSTPPASTCGRSAIPTGPGPKPWPATSECPAPSPTTARSWSPGSMRSPSWPRTTSTTRWPRRRSRRGCPSSARSPWPAPWRRPPTWPAAQRPAASSPRWASPSATARPSGGSASWSPRDTWAGSTPSSAPVRTRSSWTRQRRSTGRWSGPARAAASSSSTASTAWTWLAGSPAR
jgi:peptidoglycan/xylan/chitin deacetylase (PgdA/CDA1 family)